MPSLYDKNGVVMDRIIAERPYISERNTYHFHYVAGDTRGSDCLAELDYLAVHPDNKGKGIGTALVESGIQYAEKVRLPIFARAFMAGLGIYRRLGFKEVERVIQDDSQFGGKGKYGAYFVIYDVGSG